MRRAISFCLVVLGLSVGVARGQTGAAPGPLVHTVIEVTGEVSFKRPHWTRFAPARFGTTLTAGDLVRVGTGASAQVVCDGFASMVTVKGPGVQSVQCGMVGVEPTHWGRSVLPSMASLDLTHTPGIAYDPATFTAVRDYFDRKATATSRKQVIEELVKATGPTTFDSTPVITWLPVPGAEGYDVSVVGPDVEAKYFARTNDTASWAESPYLTAGKLYTIRVVPQLKGMRMAHAAGPLLHRTISVLEPPTLTAAFSLLLERLNVSDFVRGFLRGQMLARSKKFDDALTTLSSALASLNEPALMREIAGIHRAREDYAQAGTSYEGALKLSVMNRDIIGEALVHEELATIDARAARIASARAHLTAAIRIFDSLGDKFSVARLEVLRANYAAAIPTR